MPKDLVGELIWYRTSGRIHLGVYTSNEVRLALQRDGLRLPAYVGSLRSGWVNNPKNLSVVYRHPIHLTLGVDRVVAGPVFAILAGGQGSDFIGCRPDFRDLIQTSRRNREFIYVLPAGNVTDKSVWRGYVRIAKGKWISLPCPYPESVYNRIPFRNVEAADYVIRAKNQLKDLKIPMFNPGYFSKSVIYNALREANLGQYLPSSTARFQKDSLLQMVHRFQSVYLKPSGGSVGNGIMKLEHSREGYILAVQKKGFCETMSFRNFQGVWNAIRTHRLPGVYVLQEGINLLKWNARPCDFRVLLHKRGNSWFVVGKGVRVAGPNTITTHVPNGGYIMDARTVLTSQFSEGAPRVDAKIDEVTIACAEAIDQLYGHELGEMSMDIGVDESSNIWFFEANAKPMKFDEKEIRQKSLESVLLRLAELRCTRHPES